MHELPTFQHNRESVGEACAANGTLVSEFRIMSVGEQKLSSPDEWGSFDDICIEFALKHPEVGLTPTRWAAQYLRRHNPMAWTPDVARRTNSGRWVGHRGRLPLVLFSVLTRARSVCAPADADASAEKLTGKAQAP
jgi:hypothetical protein